MTNKKREAINMSLPLHPAYLSDWYKKEVYPVSEVVEDGDSHTVYVIFNYATKLYKIGVTKDPRRRIRQLKTSSGCNMEYVLIIELEYYYDEPAVIIEEALHAFFKHKRQKGEWFKLGVRDLVAIRSLFWEVVSGWAIHDYLKEHFNGGNKEYPAAPLEQFNWNGTFEDVFKPNI